MVSNPAMHPRQRTIVAVDIERSTTRSNVQRAELRGHLFELLVHALVVSGISERHHDRLVDRGDGALVMIDGVDEVPKTLLLKRFVPRLRDELATHNARQPRFQYRLRVAIHSGEVHYDSRGAFGEDVDITCRLLDAPELKRQFTYTTAPLVLVVSNHIYQSIVRHGYDGIDETAFHPLVTVSVGTRSHYGWVSTFSDGADQPWSFHPVTGDVQVDSLLHLAGQELDDRAAVKALDPTAVIDQMFHTERNELPGAG